jgi:hypothetical protein
MDFDADRELPAAPAHHALAERTRILTSERDAPPKGDEVDDLFMELLDE